MPICPNLRRRTCGRTYAGRRWVEYRLKYHRASPPCVKRDICIFYLSLFMQSGLRDEAVGLSGGGIRQSRVRWQISRHEGRLFANGRRTTAAAEDPMAGIHVFARPAADGRHCSARSTPALQCADRSIPSEFSAKTLDALRVDGHSDNRRQSKESRRDSTRNPL